MKWIWQRWREKALKKRLHKQWSKLWYEQLALIPRFVCKRGCTLCCKRSYNFGISIGFDYDAAGKLYVKDVEQLRFKNEGGCKQVKTFGGCKIYDQRRIVCRLFGASDILPCPMGYGPRKRLTSEETVKIVDKLYFGVPFHWVCNSAQSHLVKKR